MAAVGIPCTQIIFSLLLCVLTTTNAQNGIYISNGTHILHKAPYQKDATVVIAKPAGRIVGLSVDSRQQYIFWSDISYGQRGIYRARLNGDNPTKIVSTDLIEINGLSLDWVSKHVYWTDAKKRTIEICDYNGNYRRTLSINGLIAPRGILADPIHGYLFWNDQGTRRIERSRLDGSERRVIISKGIHWPNQMVVYDYRATSKLYWVDAWNKTLLSCELDGRNIRTVAVFSSKTGDNPIFGLVLQGGTAYVGVWNSGLVLSVPVHRYSGGTISTMLNGLGTEAMFAMAYVDHTLQPRANNPCGNDNKGGCTHLCIPIDATRYRCSCPSFGGLALAKDRKTCRAPTNMLLYALADQGEVGFIDLDGADTTDRYLVGKSLRPVSVAYDPVQEVVYWSDVHERNVHKAKVDGSGHTIMLNSSHAVGVVDGLSVDYKHRRLYYTNMGLVLVDSSVYSWHKIEMINLDGTDRRTVVNSVEKPRGLWLDLKENYLYYTDWGSKAAVVRTALDGSDPLVIKAGLDNPNAVMLKDNKLYVADSHTKTRDALNKYPRPAANGSLFMSDKTGRNWHKVHGLPLQTPFSLASYKEKIYISDWDKGSIMAVSSIGADDVIIKTVMSGVQTPMGLVYSKRQVQDNSGSSVCIRSGCGDICTVEPGATAAASCSCSSYKPLVLAPNHKTCRAPDKFVLFADMNSIKMVGLETTDHSVYTVVDGGSYFSNFAALVYRPQTKTVYFSDNAKRTIYFSQLDGRKTGILYQSMHIIDGMAIDSTTSRLYWSSYGMGLIAHIDLSGDNTTYRELIKGLDKPRAVAVDSKNGHIYWTEWGHTPRVARAQISDGKGVRTIVFKQLKRPNGLYLDTTNDKIYVGDAETRKIFECDILGLNCKSLAYVAGHPKHIYAIYKAGRYLYYTDWYTQRVDMFNMDDGTSHTLAEGLMRPAAIYVHYSGQATGCSSNSGCSDKCTVMPTGQQKCSCRPGRILKSNGKQCQDVAYPWQETDMAKCEKGCPAPSKCAWQVGTKNYACLCPPGYEGSENKCTGCQRNYYKSELGSNACRVCPGSAFTPNHNSVGCRCPKGQVWVKDKCQGSKVNSCPNYDPASGYICHTKCAQDSDCPGIQKCCQYSHCGLQCVDPKARNGCVYRGHIYGFDTDFKPNECTQCTCKRNSVGYGLRRYGGAQCAIQSCPKPGCRKYIYIPGRCCPVCVPTVVPSGKIQFPKCPKTVVVLSLKPGQNSATYNPTIEARDADGRKLVASRQPLDTEFMWKGEGLGGSYQTITFVAVPMRGKSDKGSCTVKVLVKDPQPPQLQCPSHVKQYTNNTSAKVQWGPPQAMDNVGLRSPPQSNRQFGDLFPAGDTTITYTVYDRSNNKATCTFTVTVIQQVAPCVTPQGPNNGLLDCIKDKTSHKCTVSCRKGYRLQTAVAPKYACVKGTWTPTFPKHFKELSCFKTKPYTVLVKAAVQLEAVCHSMTAGYKMAIKKGFLAAMRARYLCSNVRGTVDLCDPQQVEILCGELIQTKRTKRASDQAKKDIKISFAGESFINKTTEADRRKFALTELLGQVRRYIDSGAFTVEANGQVLSARPGSMESSQANVRCGMGQEYTDTGCMVCPAGTYLQTGSGKCTLCGPNLYQDLEGQTQCKSCPPKHTSAAGAYIIDLCTSNKDAGKSVPRGSKPGDGLPLTIIIAAAAGGGGFLLIIIIIGIVVWKCRKGKNPESSRPLSSRFNNPAYEGMDNDNPYDVIPADKRENRRKNRESSASNNSSTRSNASGGAPVADGESVLGRHMKNIENDVNKPRPIVINQNNLAE